MKKNEINELENVIQQLRFAYESIDKVRDFEIADFVNKSEWYINLERNRKVREDIERMEVHLGQIEAVIQDLVSMLYY